jgi:hypothetical protein
LAELAVRLNIQPSTQIQAQLAVATATRVLPPIDTRPLAYALMGPEVILDAIDQKLATPKLPHNPGPLADHGPVQRQLRVLLWKHGVADYDEPGLNCAELVERLEKVVR